MACRLGSTTICGIEMCAIGDSGRHRFDDLFYARRVDHAFQRSLRRTDQLPNCLRDLPLNIGFS